MKKISLTLSSVIFSLLIFAQSPQSFKYQAVYRDNTGSIIADQSIAVQIKLLQGSATGTEVFTETHNTSTNAFGLFNIEIGSVNPTDLASINWESGPYYVNTSINGTDFGTSQLLSVPYALHAKTAESITGGISGHYVGELIGTDGEDGIVFYVDQTGQHGLICSQVDIDGGSGVAWSNIKNSEIGVTAKSEFNGVTNTTAIIGQSGHTNSAAQVCLDYSTAGTSAGDWYLPSIDELNHIYNAKYEINKALNTNSFVLKYYWSSNEYSSNRAWYYGFSYGYPNIVSKSSTYRVRAVRAF